MSDKDTRSLSDLQQEISRLDDVGTLRSIISTFLSDAQAQEARGTHMLSILDDFPEDVRDKLLDSAWDFKHKASRVRHVVATALNERS